MESQVWEKVTAAVLQPGGNQVPLGKGRLSVQDGGLEFQGKKGTLSMRPIRSLNTVGAGVRVEFGEGRDLRTVVVSDWSKGIFRLKSQARAMGDALRGALRLEELTVGEAASKDRDEQARAAAGLRRARVQMWIGGFLVLAGAVATIISVSVVEGGGTYYVFWGAMIFGALGILEAYFDHYRKHRRVLGQAGGAAQAARGKTTAEPPKQAPDVERMEQERDIDGLVAALWRDELDVRVNVMAALGRLKDPRAVDLLVAALNDKRWDRRWSAAEALGKLEDRRAIEPLKVVLTDENALVVAVAEDSIRTLEGESA